MGPAASRLSSGPRFPQESHGNDFLGLIYYFLTALSGAGDERRVVVLRWLLLPSLAHGGAAVPQHFGASAAAMGPLR